jgi:hypothetical protein
MFTLAFWKDAGERAAKTFAQALLGVLAATATLATVNWSAALASAGTATVLSLLTSVVSLPVGGNGTASLLRAVRSGRHEASNPPTPEVNSNVH